MTKTYQVEPITRVVNRIMQAMIRLTHSYFDANPNSPLEAFEVEASRHPVFRTR